MKFYSLALAAVSLASALLSAPEAQAQVVLTGQIVLPSDGSSLRRTNLPKSTVSESQTERTFLISAPVDSIVNLTVTGPFFVPKNGQVGKSSALHDLTANVAFELRPVANPAVLTASSDQGDSSPEFARRVFVAAGDYHLRVIYKGSVQVTGDFGFPVTSTRTAFLVLISSGPDWDLVENSAEDNAKEEVHHVGLIPLPGTGPLVAGKRTWVITHGRNDAPGSAADGPGTFFKMAKALRKVDPTSQQALLDWTTAAAPKSSSDLSAGRWFNRIGKVLSERLAGDGTPRFAGSQLRLVGHSFGVYVNAELAHEVAVLPTVGAPSARLIALDPALLAANYTVSDVNLSADANYAFAWYASPLGNEDVTQTADDSFQITVKGTDDASVKHNAAQQFFTDMLNATDRLSARLRRAVLGGGSPVWERDPGSLGHDYNRKVNIDGDIVAITPVAAEQNYEGVFGIFLNELGRWTPRNLKFTEPPIATSAAPSTAN